MLFQRIGIFTALPIKSLDQMSLQSKRCGGDQLFGFESNAALATVVGVLIEAPAMLSVVEIVNGSRVWYEAGAAVSQRAAKA